MDEKYVADLEKHIEELKDKYGHFEFDNIALVNENKVCRERSPRWVAVPSSKSKDEIYNYVLGTTKLAVVYLEYNKSKSWTAQLCVGDKFTRDYLGESPRLAQHMVENYIFTGHFTS